jgi:hypothetical protein
LRMTGRRGDRTTHGGGPLFSVVASRTDPDVADTPRTIRMGLASAKPPGPML